MSKIVETSFGTLADPHRIAKGSASNITKKGAFYVFTLRITADDIREYSFTDRSRAVLMRDVMISHLEVKIRKDLGKES